MAYVEMFERDYSRLADAYKRMNSCPLGSGALAGTAYAVDREQLAADLGFAFATRNSWIVCLIVTILWNYSQQLL